MSILKSKSTNRVVVALIAIAMIFTSMGYSMATVDAQSKDVPTETVLQTTPENGDVEGNVTDPGSTEPSTGNGESAVTDAEPTGITLSEAELSLGKTGDSEALSVRFEPEDANADIEWASANPAIATVDAEGVVTAKAPGTTVVTAKTKEGEMTAECSVTVTNDNVLNAWVLTGYYKDTEINNTKVDQNADLEIWNKDTGKFEKTEKSKENVIGNYVQLVDTDEDKSADLIQVVAYVDGAKFWNGDAAWVNGAGADREPYPISDKEGAEIFGKEYRIPSGERLLANWGLGNWSGTTDWANYENSPYWENTDYDFYNLKSSDTLTMLTGFKTQLQETGSTCVMNSAISVLEWYGVRGDLNSRDLSSLRGENRAGKVGGTSLNELQTVFDNLGELGITEKWETKGYNDDPSLLAKSEWVQGELAKGHPIIVIWNSYGAHGQVIIGYDNMGTQETNDDVLIMMDPYDTTDHNNDGYIIQSYERLAYGLLTWSDAGTTGTKFMSVWPESGWDNYKAKKGDGMPMDKSNVGNVANISADGSILGGKLTKDESFDEIKGMKIPYGNTANDLAKFYPNIGTYYSTGLSGPAGIERLGDVQYSPYYDMLDVYGTEDEVRKAVGSDSLKILDKFQTIQQATEWTCGVTSALMTINHFGMNCERKNGSGLETDISLAQHRQDGATGATYVEGMDEIFDYMSSEYNQKWVTFSDQDLVYNEDWEVNFLGSKGLETDLVPYLIDNNVPIMIGWDEWGGHWQVIIGYDDMDTEETQDDVLILADPYDTTDHNQNGYVLESCDRLMYGWNSAFEKRNDEKTGYEDDGYNTMFIAIPNTAEYADVINELTSGTSEEPSNPTDPTDPTNPTTPNEPSTPDKPVQDKPAPDKVTQTGDGFNPWIFGGIGILALIAAMAAYFTRRRAHR